MITTDSLPQLLDQLGFCKGSSTRTLNIDSGDNVTVDFNEKRIDYPQRIKVHAGQIRNFESNENFVVLECVVRLLRKGYKPEHIELEPRWQVGHGGSGGRADILVLDQSAKPLLLIECKTAGSEFKKEWRNTLNGTGQLFSYAQQISDIRFLCLYASDLGDNSPTYSSYVIAHIDNDQYLIDNPTLTGFKGARSVEERYRVWDATYKKGYTEVGIFEDDVQPYEIGKPKLTVEDLRLLSESGVQGSKYNEFATILRQHNISGRENAFDKLVNLLLCKLVDELNNPNDLKFRWKGVAYDTHFDIMDRIQLLYHEGMKSFLGEAITYINRVDVANSMRFIRHNPDATQRAVWNLFVQQKFFTNNDFSFIDVHNERLFYQNIEVLLKVVQMWQGVKLTSSNKSGQFLGDMFEGFLDQGVKQSEGQYFTPIPICRFMLMSLPLEKLYSQPEVPMGIDYACGAGHFLTELARQARTVDRDRNANVEEIYSSLYGIEKEYRLSKIAKVAAFMHNQGAINIVHGDALVKNHDRAPNIKDGVFDVLVSNPPYSVRGFLETLPEGDRSAYELTALINDMSTSNGIETYFIERAKQLLKADGVCALILPISALANGSNVYVKAREILLGYFHILNIVELGSGTFGKTGTTTIAIFLRRRQTDPEDLSHWGERVDEWFAGCENDKRLQVLYKDAVVLESYAAHIGVAFEDYKSLMRNEADGTWSQSEYFKSTYETTFDNSPIWGERQKRRDYKQASTTDKQSIKSATYLGWVREIECDKLLYFALVSQQASPVVIVRAPDSTKEVQKVLGYTWSTRKGDEGIKLVTDSDGNHVTPMYNPSDRNDASKYSFHIAANFNGSLDESHASAIEHLQVAKLVDMLNFRSALFDKKISLLPEPTLTLRTSKWKPGVDVKSLNELVEIRNGFTPNTNNSTFWENGNIPWVTLEDLKSKYVAASTRQITDEALGKRELLPKNTVLWSSRATIGRVAITAEQVITNQGFKNLICKDENVLLPEYLYYVLQYVESDLKSLVPKGSKYQEINTTTLEQFAIPVPDLTLQRNIVEQCQKIDEEVGKAEKVVAGGSGRIRAKFESHGISNFRKLRLNELVEIRNGFTPNTNNSTFWENGNIPWVTLEDLKSKYVAASTRQITDEALGKRELLPKNTVLWSSRATIGRVAITAEQVITNQGFKNLICKDENVLLPEYLYYVLQYVESDLKSLVPKGSKYQEINTTTLEQFAIPVPDLTLQKNIVEQCQKIDEEVGKAEKTIAEEREKKKAEFQPVLEPS